jgi:16S rRNA processing protein RimM
MGAGRQHKREGSDWLRAGRVGRAHGLDGSFHVRDPRAALLAAGGEVRIGDLDFKIVRLAGHDGAPILRLAGCATREQASALTGEELFVAREAAPALGPEEWYPEQLVGCAVRDGEREVGEVRRVQALPSCEVLEVARPGAEDLLIPLVRDAVREVDPEQRRIDVDLGFLGEA